MCCSLADLRLLPLIRLPLPPTLLHSWPICRSLPTKPRLKVHPSHSADRMHLRQELEHLTRTGLFRNQFNRIRTAQRKGLRCNQICHRTRNDKAESRKKRVLVIGNEREVRRKMTRWRVREMGTHSIWSARQAVREEGTIRDSKAVSERSFSVKVAKTGCLIDPLLRRSADLLNPPSIKCSSSNSSSNSNNCMAILRTQADQAMPVTILCKWCQMEAGQTTPTVLSAGRRLQRRIITTLDLLRNKPISVTLPYPHRLRPMAKLLHR